MEKSIHPKRAYTSTRRRSQADQTRLLILEAARKLFDERGYNNATIEAIAQQAGVAAETIYAVFGNKQAILLALVDMTFTGDDEPAPLLERPFMKEAREATDQHHLIEQFSRDIYQIMTRMSPIFAMLRSISKTNPEIQTLQSRILHNRLGGMAYFVDQLHRIGSLREQILPDQASVSVWAVSSAEVFDLLTREQGWSEEQYIAWLRDTLTNLLLP